MAPPWLPNGEDAPELFQHPALALRQRDEASRGTQQLDVMDDRQQDSLNTHVIPQPSRSSHTAVTQVSDHIPSHTDTSRDDSISPTKQNTVTPTQNSSQTRAPMVQNDGNSHSSKPTTKAGPRNGPPAASERGYTIGNPEVRPTLPSYSEDEVREAMKAILNPETRPISPSHDQGALNEAVKAILNENSTKAYIQDLTKQYVQEWLNESESAIRAMTREDVRRRIRPAATRDAGTLANPARSSSPPIRNPQQQALYQQCMRQHLMQNMQQQARTPSFQQRSSPYLGSVRPESRSATPGQHGTTDNRLSQATDTQPPTTLSEVHPPQALDAEPVTTSNAMTYPRTSDAADAGFMSGHHSRDSQKRSGDCTSGSNNKRYRS